MRDWKQEQPVGWAAGFLAGQDEDHGERDLIFSLRGCKEYDRKGIAYNRQSAAAWFYAYRAGRREEKP